MEKTSENCISGGDLDALIAAHDGNMALLYLYSLRRGYDPESAARELCMTSAAIYDAAEKLRRMGCLPPASSPTPEPEKSEKLPPADELPDYSAEDIVRRSREDGTFQAIVAETQRILGRAISGQDMKKLFGIYDYLALPPEVILELLNFCVDRNREKYGPGSLPSMRIIEKEAYAWADNEILTFEQAEEYIKDFRARRTAVASAAAAMGIRGRELTATEHKYVSSWLDMGFDNEALAIAYDRTVTNTGSLKWNYMNKIILSWNDKGLHSAGEIEEKDACRRRAPAPAPAMAAKPGADSLKALKNKMKPADGK